MNKPTPTVDSVLDRLTNLQNVFAYSLEKNKLSVGQRICLTQERAGLLKWLDELYEERSTLSRIYTIPEHLDLKVKNILTEIEQQNWIKQYDELF